MGKRILIGNSVSACIESILEGRAQADEVACIIGGTLAPSAEAIFDTYWESLWQRSYHDRKEEVLELFRNLWPRTVQPRSYHMQPHIGGQPRWITIDSDTPYEAAELANDGLDYEDRRRRGELRELVIALNVPHALQELLEGTMNFEEVVCIISDTSCETQQKLFARCWDDHWGSCPGTRFRQSDLELALETVWPRIVQPRLSGFELDLSKQPTWIKANLTNYRI